MDGWVLSLISPGRASFWHEGYKPGGQASHPEIPNDLVEEGKSGKGGVQEPAGRRDVGGWRGRKTEEARGGLGAGIWGVGFGFCHRELGAEGGSPCLGVLPVCHNIKQGACEFQQPGLGSWPHFLWSERLGPSLSTSPSLNLPMRKMGMKQSTFLGGLQ